MNLNELFKGKVNNPVNKQTSTKYNELQLNKMRTKTWNNDDAFNTTGNPMLDLLFMTEYFQKHLDQVKIGTSKKEQLFSMFIRDPRHGLGRRDLGRELMKQAEVCGEDIVLAGRYDDLLYNPVNEHLDLLHKAVKSGDELAKKWMPRLNSKDGYAARVIAKMWYPNVPAQTAYKLYRKLIKVDTTENKLSRHRENEINFEHVPSLAMIKYFQAFSRKRPEDFKAYIESVKKGDKKLNVSTTNVYDIYRSRDQLDAQMFFDLLEKISISVLPILDTSGSMQNTYDCIGKATSIAHYLAKCSTYAPNQVVTFSSSPFLIDMGKHRKVKHSSSFWSCASDFKPNPNTSDYINEINSLYTGDCSNTDFGKVVDLLSGLDEGPDYFCVLSDMNFDSGSAMRKDEVMDLFKSKGIKSKIIWWNFCNSDKIATETDEYGNIFLSGYSPQLLKFLEAGFDGEKFLDNMLNKYAKAVNK